MKTTIINTLFTILLVLGGSKNILAQKIDVQSKKILDKVLNHYRSQTNNYFKFSYGSGNGKITKIQTGIFYSAPSRYKLKIMDVEQIFDGKKIYNINNDEQEITITKHNGSQVVLSPISYLENYHKNYNASYLGKKKINDTLAEYIKLTPVNNENGIKYVYLFIDSVTSHILKIEQYSADDSINSITVTDYKSNQRLANDLFIFNKNKYKNYLITEL